MLACCAPQAKKEADKAKRDAEEAERAKQEQEKRAEIERRVAEANERRRWGLSWGKLGHCSSEGEQQAWGRQYWILCCHVR